jgi:fructose-bisphosphate aldolase class I
MGAENLARYAALCQQCDLVPIVEPEVLMEGSHSIERCAEVTLEVQHRVFSALYIHGVDPNYILLKPNMILPGKDGPHCTPEQVAATTLDVLRQTVPAAVPSINFLSGGLSDLQATEYLQAINERAQVVSAPWLLSFSYGRALQSPVLRAWQGDSANATAAQDALQHRAAMNAAAVQAEYTSALEHLKHV